MKHLRGCKINIQFDVDKYRGWLRKNVTLSDPLSPESLKTLVYHLLLGKNYRLLTERNTKEKLFATYIWLTDVYNKAKEEYGNDWREKMLGELLGEERPKKEQKDLTFWLLGLTQKGAVNLGIAKNDYPTVLNEVIGYCRKLFSEMGVDGREDNTWLLMMAGSATLNIRGSQKAKIGKTLEKVFLRAMLTILGLEENETFWMNIGRDIEVEREADAEVRTRRGRIRIEVGLIAPGNQEVIEDKISRVGRNGIVIFDKLGPRSRVYETAERNHVKLIQIRNNQPLIEIYRHLKPLVDIELRKPSQTEKELKKLINKLSDETLRPAT